MSPLIYSRIHIAFPVSKSLKYTLNPRIWAYVLGRRFSNLTHTVQYSSSLDPVENPRRKKARKSTQTKSPKWGHCGLGPRLPLPPETGEAKNGERNNSQIITYDGVSEMSMVQQSFNNIRASRLQAWPEGQNIIGANFHP